LSQRYFIVKSPHGIRKATLIHRVAVALFWKGDQPGPEDLLRQLREPFQLKLIRAHTELNAGIFPISATYVVASTEFVRKTWSVESVAETFGMRGTNVRRTLGLVRQQVGNAQRRAARKRNRKARKPK
jgi:hypothetical protein